MDTVVELEGVNGEWFTLAGPNEGDRGVYLGTGVKGLYDPPVKVVYEEPGNYPGARYLNHRILRRDITFGVEILNDRGSNSWLSRDSEWRKAWAFDRDCKLYITTEESGRRYLKIRLLESPDVSLFNDPKKKSVNQVVMTCVAGDPFWYEDDVVYSAVTEEDTTFDPNPLPWPWPQPLLPTETLTIKVDPTDGDLDSLGRRGGLNPTDQPIFMRWSVPGSTLPPALPYVPGLPWLGAPNSPATIWTLPDYSFDDPEKANRRLRLPGLIGGLRTEEVQGVFISGRPTGGTFTLSFDGETTTPIAYNATNSTIRAQLVALAGLAFNDVQVDRATATNEVQQISLSGGPTDGTFTLTFNGETTAPMPFNANAGTMQQFLRALPSVGDADVTVTAQEVNEVQVIQLVGEPTSGTFTLSFDGESTRPIPWDAPAYVVQDALEGLSSIDEYIEYLTILGFVFPFPIGESADVAVSKPSGSYQPWKITFQRNLAGINLQQITADPSNLAGGAGIDIETTTETHGTRLYTVTFTGALSGVDFPVMTADPSGLEGGVDPQVNITTVVQGARPYLVTFTGAKQGLDVPAMTVNTSGLTGPDISGFVSVLREGFTAPAENCIIDSDPRVEQVTSESGSQIWARMNGVRFRHPVPPYTESKTFEITVSGCVPGQMVTLRLPRPWTRPWGLE